MLRDKIATRPSAEPLPQVGSALVSASSRHDPLPQTEADAAKLPGHRPKPLGSSSHLDAEARSGPEENENKKAEPSSQGHALFQEPFFVCTVKQIGDVPGVGSIYLEIVVDRDTGVAFAKVYSAKAALNAVDILATRVLPFFDRQGLSVREIHTHSTSEYCGLFPRHAYETFLVTNNVKHLPMEPPCHSHNDLCEEFYLFLRKEFLGRALRRRFRLSLDELQKDLDAFVEAYNAVRMKQSKGSENAPHLSAKFPVDL